MLAVRLFVSVLLSSCLSWAHGPRNSSFPRNGWPVRRNALAVPDYRPDILETVPWPGEHVQEPRSDVWVAGMLRAMEVSSDISMESMLVTSFHQDHFVLDHLLFTLIRHSKSLDVFFERLTGLPYRKGQSLEEVSVEGVYESAMIWMREQRSRLHRELIVERLEVMKARTDSPLHQLVSWIRGRSLLGDKDWQNFWKSQYQYEILRDRVRRGSVRLEYWHLRDWEEPLGAMKQMGARGWRFGLVSLGPWMAHFSSLGMGANGRAGLGSFVELIKRAPLERQSLMSFIVEFEGRSELWVTSSLGLMHEVRGGTGADRRIAEGLWRNLTERTVFRRLSPGILAVEMPKDRCQMSFLRNRNNL